jgi:hypothetical protein
MPVCEACKSPVSEVTHEFENALCDLCLEIQRYDRKIRVFAKEGLQQPIAWLTSKLSEPECAGGPK